jgi:hypothetical protein
MATKSEKRAPAVKWERMQSSQERFLTASANCGSVKKASHWAQMHRESHYRWLSVDPTYQARFDEAMTRSTRILEDKAMELAVEGVEKLVLHNGRPVYVNGSRLYEREYDPQMIPFLLAAMNREKYGERKVVEVSFRDWDGDISKLSEPCIRGIVEILRRQEAAKMTANGTPALEPGTVLEAVAEEIIDNDDATGDSDSSGPQ